MNSTEPATKSYDDIVKSTADILLNFIAHTPSRDLDDDKIGELVPSLRRIVDNCAQAVLQHFLSAGPVSADDLADWYSRPHGPSIPEMFKSLAAHLNALLAARYANPVQAEGGEWRELVKGEIIESGDAWFNGDVYEYTTDLIGEVYVDNIRPKVLRRRIPTVQPAVAVPTAAQGQRGPEELNESLDFWKSRCREVDAALEQTEELLTASQARVAWAEAGNKSMLKAMEIRDKELVQSRADLEAMKVRAEALNVDRDGWTKAYYEIAAALPDRRSNGKADIIEHINTLTHQFAEHVRQITINSGTIKRLQDAGLESDLKAQDLEKEITALRQERDRSDQDWANAKKECESLRFHLTEAKRVLAEARKEVERLKHRLHQANFPTQQATECGKCGQYKHTPWKDDDLGYVCATCLTNICDEKIASSKAERDKALAEVERLKEQESNRMTYDLSLKDYMIKLDKANAELSQLRARGGVLTVEQVTKLLKEHFRIYGGTTITKFTAELNAQLSQCAETKDQRLDREFAAWLTKHNFSKDLPESALKLLRPAAFLVEGHAARATQAVEGKV